MKNFKNYCAPKYAGSDFKEVKDGIYQTKSPYSDETVFVTSLCFETEPECYGEEGSSPRNIPQIPFEDILDEFCVYVTDFYDSLNRESVLLCYQEFGSDRIEDLEKLRTLIGKRCYAKPHVDEKNGGEYYDFVIE